MTGIRIEDAADGPALVDVLTDPNALSMPAPSWLRRRRPTRLTAETIDQTPSRSRKPQRSSAKASTASTAEPTRLRSR